MDTLQEIEVVARSYFQKLFSEEIRRNYDHLLTGIDRCITEKDNHRLTAPYNREGIREAVFDIGLTKAPREDGFLVIFYKKCWHFIGEDVTLFCLNLLNGEMEVSSINSTNIVLIPKTASPSNMTQFRLISLCNVIYKVLAKAMANRFRGVIEKCIGCA